MPAYPKPVPGSDASLVMRADVWRDLLSMLADYNKNKFSETRPAKRHGTCYIKNDTGADIAAGQLVQVGSLTQPNISGYPMATHESPILSGTVPVWHSAIDNLVICDRPVPDGDMFPYNPKSYSIVGTTGSVGADVAYLMPDPSNPRECKRTSGGLFRVLGFDSSNNVAIVERSDLHSLWTYELLQDSQAPNSTSAQLRTLDDTNYGNINLLDPQSLMSDQVTGDKGFCLHVGNTFYAIQAVCN